MVHFRHNLAIGVGIYEGPQSIRGSLSFAEVKDTVEKLGLTAGRVLADKGK